MTSRWHSKQSDKAQTVTKKSDIAKDVVFVALVLSVILATLYFSLEGAIG